MSEESELNIMLHTIRRRIQKKQLEMVCGMWRERDSSPVSTLDANSRSCSCIASNAKVTSQGGTVRMIDVVAIGMRVCVWVCVCGLAAADAANVICAALWGTELDFD